MAEMQERRTPDINERSHVYIRVVRYCEEGAI